MAAKEPLAFSLDLLEMDGDVQNVQASDLDGDGKLDLVVALVKSEKSAAHRSLGVFWNQGRRFGSKPDLILAASSDLAAYELADVDSQPGAELIEMTSQGLRARNFSGRSPAARLSY